MKLLTLLLAISAVGISSCTTAYRTGQTPDDVYYSPTRPQDEYVRVKDYDDRYDYADDYYDDRYLRMKVQNHNRWNYLDDWYLYDRYSYRYNYYYGSYYNPYTSWNYYYNPYCPNTAIVYNPKIPNMVATSEQITKPRNFNLLSYTNTAYNYGNNNRNSVSQGIKKPFTSSSSYNNRNNGLSNSLRSIFSNSNGNSRNNSSYSPPTRSYNPTNNSSSSGSSSSGNSSGSSKGSVTRPTRGG